MNRAHWRRVMIVPGVLGIMFVFIVLNCSGLNFPVIGKQASLSDRVREDFGVVLPPSLRVVDASRVASRDPAYFYGCEIPAGDIGKLIGELKVAAVREGYSTDEGSDKRYAFGANTPNWYTPGGCADIRQLKVQLPDNGHRTASGYWFFYSIAEGKVWVFWYST